jgi:hypothetical protein
MINDPAERLARSVFGRPVTITLTEGTEQRVRAFIDRVNADMRRHPDMFGPDDFSDPDSDDDIIIAITACLDRGLTASEADDGLVGYGWGDIVSCEQHDEVSRRRRWRLGRIGPNR